jgi:hypothetical protein
VLVPDHHDKIRIVVATAPPKLADQLAGAIERSFVAVWPHLRTTLLGEAQVGAGQSVDARLCTLVLM